VAEADVLPVVVHLALVDAADVVVVADAAENEQIYINPFLLSV
jgi:hypothetical protein